MARPKLGNRIATLVATRFRLYIGPGKREAVLRQAIVFSGVVLLAALALLSLLGAGEAYKFLLQSVATICLSVLGLCFIFFLLLLSAEESARIKRSEAPRIPESLSLPINIPTERLKITLDRADAYEMPQWLVSLLRSLPFDRQEYYALHAGSVDFPKIRLIGIERDAETMRFRCGSTSYIDHFYSHLFFDFLLAGGKDEATTLRTVLSEDIESHYTGQIRNFIDGHGAQLAAWPQFPGTLGITALVRVRMPNGKQYCFFKQRTDDVVAHARAIQSTLAFTYNTMRVPSSSGEFPLTKLLKTNYGRNFVTPFCDAILSYHPSGKEPGVREAMETTAASWLETATAKAITFGPALGYQPEILILIEGDLAVTSLPHDRISRIAKAIRRHELKQQTWCFRNPFIQVPNGKALMVEDHGLAEFVRRNELAGGANRIRPVDLELLRLLG